MSLDQLKAESLRLDEGLQKVESKHGKNILRSQKRSVSNFIAAKTLARDCYDLLKADPSMISGSYWLHPTGKLEDAEETLCLIEDSTVALSKKRERVTLVPACINDNSCVNSNTFTQDLTCGIETKKGKVKCPFVGVARRPKVKEQLSKAPCVYGKTFGFNEKEVWTNKRCRATFTLDKISYSGR